MFAIRDDREYIQQEDLTKAARKVSEAKKHESQSFNFSSVHLLQSLNVRFTDSQDGIFYVDRPIVLFLLYVMRFGSPQLN